MEAINFRENELKNTKRLVMDQCLPALWAQLKGAKGCEAVNTNHDVAVFLQIIQGLCCCHDQNNNNTYAVVISLKNLYFY